MCHGNAVVDLSMEITTETTSTVGSRSPFDRTGQKPSTRSKAANGKLLPLSDGRSATARRFKDLVFDIAADLGGVEHLSTAEMQLIRRASMLSAECERQEALAVREDVEFDCDGYVVKTNALRRVFEAIGLKRAPRDVTPDLRSYLRQRGNRDEGRVGKASAPLGRGDK
jgi:hypothetical protein